MYCNSPPHLFENTKKKSHKYFYFIVRNVFLYLKGKAILSFVPPPPLLKTTDMPECMLFSAVTNCMCVKLCWCFDIVSR